MRPIRLRVLGAAGVALAERVTPIGAGWDTADVAGGWHRHRDTETTVRAAAARPYEQGRVSGVLDSGDVALQAVSG
jgi:hypothetical protein